MSAMPTIAASVAKPRPFGNHLARGAPSNGPYRTTAQVSRPARSVQVMSSPQVIAPSA